MSNNAVYLKVHDRNDYNLDLALGNHRLPTKIPSISLLYI